MSVAIFIVVVLILFVLEPKFFYIFLILGTISLVSFCSYVADRKAEINQNIAAREDSRE